MIPIVGLPLGDLRGLAEFWISPTVRQSEELELLQATLSTNAAIDGQDSQSRGAESTVNQLRAAYKC